MNKILIITLATTLFCNIALAGEKKNEAYYQELDCKERGGIVEYKLSDNTRVDCLTDTLAIEYDFAYKWYECITQSLHYAMHTNTQAICSLIFKKDNDIKYKNSAEALIQHYNLPVLLEVINDLDKYYV